MRKAVLVLLVTLIAVGGVFANGQKDDGKIVIGHTFYSDQNPFQHTMKEMIVKAVEAKGWEIKVIDPMYDIEKQIAAVETFVSLGVDAVILNPLDYTGSMPAAKLCNDSGIPLVCVNSRMNPEAGDFIYVGSDNYDAGKIQGEYMAKVLPKNANIVYLQGTPGTDHAVKRRQAILDTVINVRKDITLLADQTANYDRAEGMMVMEDWIQAFPKIDGVIAANDQMALGALEAIKGARLSGVMIAGIDGTIEADQCVKEGTFTMSVLQDQAGQSQASVDTIEKMLNGETVTGDVMVPFKAITIENVDEYLN